MKKSIMKNLTPLKAIRENCLECQGGSPNEVRKCTMKNCPLYLFRFGHNPKRAGVGGNPKW